MARKKKTKTEAQPAELSLTNPAAAKSIPEATAPAEADETREAPEPEASSPAETTITVSGEDLQRALPEMSEGGSGEAEAEPTVTDEGEPKGYAYSPADIGYVSGEEPEPAPKHASQAALRPSPVVTTEARDARSLGTEEHGGIREDRLLTREANGDLVYGLDPAGPTARVYQRGDVHLGQAMYGQTVVCRVRGASEEQACADLARGITEASRPEAESFRRAVRWGE